MQTRSNTIQNQKQTSSVVTFAAPAEQNRYMTTRSKSKNVPVQEPENNNKVQMNTRSKATNKVNFKTIENLPMPVIAQMEGIRTRAQRLVDNNMPKNNGLRQSPRLIGNSKDYVAFFQ
jgi:hypothetical protein